MCFAIGLTLQDDTVALLPSFQVIVVNVESLRFDLFASDVRCPMINTLELAHTQRDITCHEGYCFYANVVFRPSVHSVRVYSAIDD